jgi:alpha-glucosidase (family GH31 glycosyl hydrolase)
MNKEGLPTRITFLRDDLIRLEESPSGDFVDAPSLFAAARPSESVAVEESMDGAWKLLRSAKLELRFLNGAETLSADTLEIRALDGSFSWKPGQKQTGNLLGPLQTLDGVRGRVEMPEGLLSRDGWYVVDDSRGPLLEDGWIRPRPAIPNAPTTSNSYRVSYGKDWYFFGYGKDYQAGLDALMTVSGPVPLPRRATLGSWYCRWYPFTSEEYRELVAEYGREQVPLDVLVLDMDWHRLDAVDGLGMQDLTLGWTGYSWNRDLLPDAEELVREMKDKGLTLALNDHPHDGLRHHEDGYADFMQAMGEKGDGRNLPFNGGDRRYWETFWKHSHLPKENDGIDMWWLDWQQDDIMPYVPGLGKLPHLPWLNHLYFKESQRSGKRGQSFSRWGGLGDHRHPIHFSGDIESNWEAFAFEVEFTVRSSNSGCYFWSHDIGGFYGKPDAELYTRWMQFGAFSASLRLHSCGPVDRRPWRWDEPFASEMKNLMRMRGRWMPTVYTAAWQCATANKPLLRPMYLEWPEEEAAYEHLGQYLFGDHVLVAPVTERMGEDGTAPGRCWLPPGTWVDFWTGERFEGGQVIGDRYPLDRFPLYLRAGAVIPLRNDSLRPASENISELTLLWTPAEKGETVESLWVDDDGIGPRAERPALRMICTGNQLRLEPDAAPVQKPGLRLRNPGNAASAPPFSFPSEPMILDA